MIQGGDPEGDGTGGPGYRVVEAPPKKLKYTKGIVAMAKAASERVGTSGSQFFVVSGNEAAQLSPDYALLGAVSSGQRRRREDQLDRGRPNNGAPEHARGHRVDPRQRALTQVPDPSGFGRHGLERECNRSGISRSEPGTSDSRAACRHVDPHVESRPFEQAALTPLGHA